MYNNPRIKVPVNPPYYSMPCSLFSSASNGYKLYQPTLRLGRESRMVAMMNAITDKPDWYINVFNNNIAEKWKEEAIRSDGDITESMANWCIDELRFRVKNCGEGPRFVTVYEGDVIKSDTAVPHDLKEALKNSVKSLENVPASEKDWRPVSGRKLLDLVHPSLFPFVHGFSRILPDSITDIDGCVDQCGEGITLHLEQTDKNEWNVNCSSSLKFQWLPCEVDVSGDTPKIISYINNLHPHKHKELYNIIEKIIGCTIPLWNTTLTPQNVPGDIQARLSYPYPYESTQNELEQGQEVKLPEVGPFKPMKYIEEVLNHDGTLKDVYRIDLINHYDNRPLQVIVKLTNIYLTPENPTYEGSIWHAEGQPNEHICAIAIYCYDSENIEGSLIAFRQDVYLEDDEKKFPHNRDFHEWMIDSWNSAGAGKGSPLTATIGRVDIRDGRLITFPNIIEHTLDPFKLADSTRPGHQKILALLLVDPGMRVISTANVPCQRLDWWRESIEEKQTWLEHLPLELKDIVFEQVEGFPISMKTAKELRVEFMNCGGRSSWSRFEPNPNWFSI